MNVTHRAQFCAAPLLGYAAPASIFLALLLTFDQGAAHGQAAARPGPAFQGAAMQVPTRNQEDGLIDSVIEPDLVFHVDPTRSKLVRTKQPVTRIAITDPEVLEVTQYSPTEFEFIGRSSGETTLTMWFGAAGQPVSVLRYLVRVGPDKAELEKAEIEYGDLQGRINELFPNSQVILIPIADKLIVKGQARDAEEATQILAVIRSESSGQSNDASNGVVDPVVDGTVARIPGAESLPTAQVVNLLQVPGEQQVMLKVRIAELTRTALRELGTDFSIVDDNFAIDSVFGGAANITAILDGGDIELFIRAFSSNGNGKILAEPTLVTLSGHTATFIAGGEFAVPTAVGIDGIAAASTRFRGFGTQLSFTPTVLDKDRVRLQVTPSFSTLNEDNTVDGIPGLNTRAVATTVDLREGQWLAIAGLIQDEQRGTKERIPFLGDIPIVGAVFSHSTVDRAESELVVLVSPELVHPLEQKQVPLLVPGMLMTEPNNKQFFLHQQIEGRPDCHFRSTVWPTYHYNTHYNKKNCGGLGCSGCDKSNSSYQQAESHYLSGPQGFSQ